jgi:transposase
MATDRRSYTEDFKREAVRLMETSGKPVAQIARDLGVNDNNLYRWRGLYGSQDQTRANDNPKVLRQERDILKKAMSIVSRSQP